MSQKLTPWFPGHIEPARPGVYEVYWAIQTVYAMWTGWDWRCGSANIYRASIEKVGALQTPHFWRGLAEKP